MKDIFGKNNYKYGVESFLLMYLNQFQFVLGSDIENYSTISSVFDNDNPCNIYFILRRPKVTLAPDSVKIKGKVARLNFIVHHQNHPIVVNMGFEFKKAKSKLEFLTEYPYNLFALADKNGVLFGGRPSTIIDNVHIENNIDTTILDYEILYIGQAYGKNGKRTAVERLLSHETLQRIYAHSSTQYPESDIWVMLSKFSQQSILCAAGSGLIKVTEKNKVIENKKIEHIFENDGLCFSERQKINFTEAALIKYFQPKYNIEYKQHFPNPNHKSYSECYSLDVRGMIIELDTSETPRKIYTEKTGRKTQHIETFEFTTDKDRYSMFNLESL